MIDKKFLIFGIIFLFCSIVSADIISVNSGGSKDIVITPDKYIEGFFSFVNNLPIASNLVLFSSSGLNTTNENLSISYDANDVDADIITNITDWRLNGNSIAVLNMPFDKNVGELSSGAIRDYSTYANNATLGGGTKAYAPSWNSTCQVGGCYTFDGVDDYLDVPAVLSGKREFYMSLWVKSSGNLENTYGVLIGSIDSAWSSGDWMFFVRDTGKIVGYVRDNSNNAKRVENLSLTSIFDSSWHYIGFGFNGTHLFSVLDGEISLGESLTLSSIGSGQTRISKKGNAVDASNYDFNGSIDEVQIFDRVLSETQIKELYQAGLAGHQLEKIVSDETDKGDSWQVALTPNDKIGDGETILSNVLNILDYSPENPENVQLVSIDGTNESDVDLNCSAFIEDKDNPLLDVYVNWFKDNISVLNQTFLDETNGTIFSTLLNSNNLTLGDVWKCSIRTYDENDYSSWVDSNGLEIIDITPPEVFIISPEDTNYSTLNVDFNVSVNDNENTSMCFYSLDGETNISMNKLNDSYFWYFDSTLSPGKHNITYYCNDTSNNWGTNFTNFTIEDEAAISIELSEALLQTVKWEVNNLPANDLDALGNNGENETDYYINISTINSEVDLYMKADGDLINSELDILGLKNETYSVSLTDRNLTGAEKYTMNTTYTLIGSQISGDAVLYLKFYLDAPAAQPAGVYFNSLDFRAVQHGESI